MTVELIGIITFVVGLLTVRYGPNFGIYALMIATLMGAAAAIKLPALSNANVLPAHALLLFYLIAVARLPRGIGDGLRSLAPPGPGFWLAAFVAYGVLAALFLPRLFAGSIEVFSITRYGAGQSGGWFMAQLAPSAGNLTQALYLVGDLAVFAAVMAHAAAGGLTTIVRAVLAAAAANLLFAVADLVTYGLALPEAMSFLRNANYEMLVEGDIHGIKRLVGSFSEASAFGGITLAYFAFCFELWLRGVYPRCSGLLALLSFLFVVASTSSSAYVGLAIYAAVILLRCVVSLAAGATTRRAAALTFAIPVSAVLLLLGLALIPSVWTLLAEFVDQTLLSKLQTQSGIERSLWNEHAMAAFFESFALGVGVGSVRASSFFVSILASTGLIGLVLMSAMLVNICVLLVRGSPDRTEAGFIAAGGGACFALMLAAGLTASSVDLGLLFYVNAAIVTSAAQRASLKRGLIVRGPSYPPPGAAWAPATLAGARAARIGRGNFWFDGHRSSG